LSIFDEFSARGRFWLPGAESSDVPGQLSFSGGGIRLMLDGKFAVGELQTPGAIFGCSFRPSVIVGETVEGESCMLLKAVTLNVNWNSCEFAANQMLVGESRFGEVVPQAERMLVSLTHLEDWAFMSLIQAAPGDPGTFEIIVPIERIELLRVESDQPYSRLILFGAVVTEQIPGEVRCATRCHFEVTFPKPAAISEAIDLVGQLCSVLSLLVGGPVYAKKIRMEFENESIAFFSPSRQKKSVTIRAPEMPLPLRVLDARERELFKSWLEHSEQMNPVYGLLLSTMFEPAQYQQTIFLNLMQAIESFHRRVYGGEIVAAERYKLVRDALAGAIPQGADPDLVEKLTRLIEFGNEPSLKKRLRSLCATLKPETVQAILGVDDLTRFLQLLADLRNYFTHYNESLMPRISHIVGDPIAGYNLNQRLRAFAALLVLKHLGLGEEKTARGLVSHLGLAY
jgi:hypothetical protein